jgi:hypothetical protein
MQEGAAKWRKRPRSPRANPQKERFERKARYKEARTCAQKRLLGQAFLQVKFGGYLRPKEQVNDSS